jgi:hypothetical protein
MFQYPSPTAVSYFNSILKADVTPLPIVQTHAIRRAAYDTPRANEKIDGETDARDISPDHLDHRVETPFSALGNPII